MECRFKNPHSALLAYRWYFANIPEVIAKKDVHRRHAKAHEGYIQVFSKTLNNEISVYFTVELTVDDDNEDYDEDAISIGYVMEMTSNCLINHQIDLFEISVERSVFMEKAENVKSQIETFCAQTFLVCKCNRLAKAYLDKKCVECYLYAYQREDNDCCAVCLEDEGRWVQLPCKHLVHTYCWIKTRGQKCPICRAFADSSQVLWDYPYRSL